MDTITMWAATERVRRLADEAARDRRAAACAPRREPWGYRVVAGLARVVPRRAAPRAAPSGVAARAA
jgi:hypothetical protein